MIFKKVSTDIVTLLKEERMNLSHLWLLERFYSGIGLNTDAEDIYQSLERKLLVQDGKITPLGTQYYENILKKKKIQKVSEIEADNFKKWWKVFPSTDNFTYKNKEFSGSRVLRMKENDCLNNFNKLIISGEFTVDQIINGTTNHIELTKMESLKKGENKLSFIPNSERYLREKLFAPFIKASIPVTKEPERVNPKDLF